MVNEGHGEPYCPRTPEEPMVLKHNNGLFYSPRLSLQHWKVFSEVNEVFILVPALLGLKGNLEMTLASRLSTAVSLTQ